MSKKLDVKKLIKDYGIIVIFIFAIIVLGIVSPTFRMPLNMLNVLKQASVNGILAMAMSIVIISGGIDLSIGSVVGLTGVGAALCGHEGQFPLIVPILAAVMLGVAIGLINGVGVAYGGLPPFIITLGTMSVARGLALVISDGAPIIGLSESFQKVASGTILHLPNLSYFLIAVMAIMAFVLNKTVFGRRIFMIGGNATAAMVSGINVKKHTVIVYVISGILSGLGGFLMASRINQGAPTTGVTYEMDAVTAAVIGGVSMTGGVGKWYGILVGALFIAVIENGLTLFGVDPNWKQVVKGAIIIGAVLLDVKSKGKRN